ncbi:MAG: fibrobacter succinogenes major paralogous domain-containing protein [Bacteroidales bacterium]|jgi:uncharacterized protein (TIGR02145 family)
MMNPVKVKIQIGIVVIIFSLSGCKKTETEKILAITTDNIEIYSEGIYTLKGTIVSIGKEEINEHGFYWSESTNPEINGTLIQLGPINSTGSFSSTVYDILPGTTYYVKAFAITNSIPYYGDEKSFKTPDTLVLPIIDIDHNIYYPVNIGDQTWMSDNLKVSHYPDGSIIPRIEDRLTWFNMPWYNSAYCWYENYSAIAGTYGNLYTWPAAMNLDSGSDIKTGNVQGVCPDGWHLPSDSEWKQLEMFLGMSQAEVDEENWRGEDEGGKMKNEGIELWKTPNTGATDESRFRALPAGWRDGAGYFTNIGTSIRFWSSSIRGDYAWVRQLDYNSSQIYRGTTGVYEGISVRCIKDPPKNK